MMHDIEYHLSKAESHLELAIHAHIEAREDSESAGDVWSPKEKLEYRDTLRRFEATLQAIRSAHVR
jgi:hypothetical protein